MGQNWTSTTMVAIVHLMLLCLQVLPASLIVWSVYCAVIGGMFTLIKFTNYRLHHMYDTSEMFEDENASDESDKNDETSKTSETGTSKNQTQG